MFGKIMFYVHVMIVWISCFLYIYKKENSHFWEKSELCVAMATKAPQIGNDAIFTGYMTQQVYMISFIKIWEMPFPGHFDAYRQWLLNT